MTEPQTSQAGERTHTITQSEELAIGERREYVGGPKFTARCQKLGVRCWVEKQKPVTSRAERTLGGLLADFAPYTLVYGLSYKGSDYAIGNMPRDLGKALAGIEIAVNA